MIQYNAIKGYIDIDKKIDIKKRCSIVALKLNKYHVTLYEKPILQFDYSRACKRAWNILSKIYLLPSF